jgi:DnaJ-like protein
VTERKPADVNFESWIDRQIREATERGEFDNLPGAGKPLPGLQGPVEEQWWLKDYLRREGLPSDVLLPTPLLLRKEVEALPETVRGSRTEAEVRELVAELNLRIVEWLRFGDGPRVPLSPVNVDKVVERWRAETRRPARSTPPPAPLPPPPARWWHRWTRQR